MLTFIDTKSLPRVKTPHGEMTEILNRELCGAQNVLGVLRWIKPGESFQAEPSERHQLIYLMEGHGQIRLNGKDYGVAKGSGIYLGPSEGAEIRASGSESLKVFQLVVPKIPA
jgi:quercetin dioxygenase-like cupin family protein